MTDDTGAADGADDTGAAADADDDTETTGLTGGRRSFLSALGAFAAVLGGGRVVTADAASRTVPPEDRYAASSAVPPGDRYGVYDGTITTEITYPSTVETTQLPVRVFLLPPIQSGSFTESNPFSFTLSTFPDDTSGQTVEGDLFLVSALPMIDPEDMFEFLLQYWSLQYDDATGAVTGELTDTHAAQGAALNTLYAWDETLGMVFSYFLYAGATLDGRFDGDTLQFRIEGEAVSAFAVISFVATVEASRSIQQPPLRP